MREHVFKTKGTIIVYSVMSPPSLNKNSIIILFLIYLQIILSPDIVEKCVNNVDRDAYQAQH